MVSKSSNKIHQTWGRLLAEHCTESPFASDGFFPHLGAGGEKLILHPSICIYPSSSLVSELVACSDVVVGCDPTNRLLILEFVPLLNAILTHSFFFPFQGYEGSLLKVTSKNGKTSSVSVMSNFTDQTMYQI